MMRHVKCNKDLVWKQDDKPMKLTCIHIQWYLSLLDHVIIFTIYC